MQVQRRARPAAMAVAFGVFGALGLFAAASVALPGVARANGRFPASNGVIFSPADEATLYVRVTFGLLVTRDRGQSWKWICERAIGFSGPEDPSYVITKSGALVAGLFDGLRVSRDNGCTWSAVKTSGTVFVDVTSRADGAVVALASSYDHFGDGGSLFKSQLWISTDDAASFVPLGPRLDPTLLAESVEVAPGDPARIYVSAVRGEDVKRQGVLLVSSDGGAHFTERPLKLEGKELAPFIAAVDPKHAERIYLRTSASPENGTRLLVTDDAGKAYRTLVSAKGPLLGFALSPDGARLHVGGPDDGLLGGAAESPALTAMAPLKVQCLARSGDVLWACSSEAGGFVAGSAKIDSATSDGPDASDGRNASAASDAMFQPRLHLRDIAGPMTCAEGTAVARDCPTDWRKLRDELGLGGAADGPTAKPAAHPEAPSPAGEQAMLRGQGVFIAAGLVAAAAAILALRSRFAKTANKTKRRR